MAGSYTVVIEQGATYDPVMTYKDSVGNPINLTGYTFRGHMRKTVAATVVELDFALYVTLGGAAGTITFNIPDTVTDDLVPGNYVYDMELESAGGVTRRILEGAVRVVAEVTR